MLAYLRARALSKGFLGGSRFWIGLGFVVVVGVMAVAFVIGRRRGRRNRTIVEVRRF